VSGFSTGSFQSEVVAGSLEENLGPMPAHTGVKTLTAETHAVSGFQTAANILCGPNCLNRCTFLSVSFGSHPHSGCK